MNSQTRRGGDLASLVRPEALQGKAYARLARPPLIANVPLGRPLAATFASGSAIVALLAVMPVSTSYRGHGIVSEAHATTVIRAPRPGQVMRILTQGSDMEAADAVVEIEQPLLGEGGRDPAALTRAHLSRVIDERDAELRLATERHDLALLQVTERERSLQRQLASRNEATRNIAALARQAQQLADRVAADAAGHVSRLDALAIGERTVAARNRHLELDAEANRLRSELAELARHRRIAQIDRLRELDEIKRRHAAQEAALLERSGAQAFSVPAQRRGTVLAVYRQRGDWVSAGDELVLMGPRGDRGAQLRLKVPVPPELANLVAAGQAARVWVNPKRRSEAPFSAKVLAVEQRAGTAATAPEHRRAFVVEVAVDDRGVLARSGLADMRPGSRVEVEIIFGAQPLYESLLPRRAVERIGSLHEVSPS
jgi:biotin carboxyl carrier protein